MAAAAVEEPDLPEQGTRDRELQSDDRLEILDRDLHEHLQMLPCGVLRKLTSIGTSLSEAAHHLRQRERALEAKRSPSRRRVRFWFARRAAHDRAGQRAVS